MKKCYIDFEFNKTSEPQVNLIACSFSTHHGTKNYWLGGHDRNKFLLKKILAGMKDKFIFVSYSVEAEARSFLALGLNPVEFYWIDLYLEYRMLLNHNHKYAYGKQLNKGKEIITRPPPLKYDAKSEEDLKKAAKNKPQYNLGAACYKMLNIKIDTEHKKLMQQRIINGTSFVEEEKKDIVDYCASDIVHLQDLYKAIKVAIIKDTAKLKPDRLIKDMTLRGEFAARTAIMVSKGYPVDKLMTKRFYHCVPSMLRTMQEDINNLIQDEIGFAPFIWGKKENRYKEQQKLLKEYIETLGFSGWIQTKTKTNSLSLEAFEKFSSARHDFKPTFLDQMIRFKRFRQSLNGFLPLPPNSKKKTFFDSMGSDGRVRPHFGIYSAQSARSQPSATGYLPLKAAWMRVMIQAPKGKMIIDLDYGQQEFLIAALLSEDKNMIAAYMSGDPYLWMAKQAGAVPQTATKASHKEMRDVYKTITLGISYKMGAASLSKQVTATIGKTFSESNANYFIDQFYSLFPTYAEWGRDIVTDYADVTKLIRLPCGWYMFGDNRNQRSVGNIPIQGLGSSIMRKAVALAQDAGLNVILTLHDALYIEQDLFDWAAADKLRECMSLAFHFYMPQAKKHKADIRMDLDAWGFGLKKQEYVTPDKHTVGAKERYIDGRTKKEYEKFKKYLYNSEEIL